MTILESINLLCANLNTYGAGKQYFVWLPRTMFQQVLRDLKTRIISYGLHEIDAAKFNPEDLYNEDKFVYQDPQGFTHTFQIANIFMITVQ